MELNEQQKRIWKTMIKLTGDYLEGAIEFRYLVYSLQGALDTCELKDNIMIKQWYDFWTPLEIINSETEFNVENKEKKRVVKNMKKYLENIYK